VNSSTKSLSQLSISQDERRISRREEDDDDEISKKVKYSTYARILSSSSNTDSNDNNNHINNRYELRNEDNSCTLYELSKYLRMPRRLLMHSLQLQLNCTRRLKWKKKERHFLFKRLQLFDRQFYLDQIRYLYKFYFEQGFKYQTWSVSFLKTFCVCIYYIHFIFFLFLRMIFSK
jgi:hypothetical protein